MNLKPVLYVALILLLIVPLTIHASTPSSTTTAQASHAPPVYIPLVTTAAPPTYPYEQAMRDGFTHDAIQPTLPHYDLTIRVDPVNKRLSGRVELWFRNTTGATLRDVVMRLYPNFPPDLFGDGGDTRMTVRDVVAQNRSTTAQYEAQDTAVRVPLVTPATPGHIVSLGLDFETNFTTFHPEDRSFALPSYYPMLAVWQNGWRTDVSGFPDRVYATSGLYHARITVPGGWSVISTGSNLGTTTNGDGSVTVEAVSGPVREFAFSVGRFASASAEHEGTTVVVWYEQNSGLASAAASSLEHLKRALSTFNHRYGPYPFRALELQLVLDTQDYNYGIEYPGLIYIISNGSYSTGTRRTISHELAHQWYYGVLGNDVFNEAWLDEAFAYYSPYLVEAQWYGQAAADSYYQNTMLANANRATKPAGLSVWEYGDWNSYYYSVYGRGSLFLSTLRGKIGDTAFFGALRDLSAQRKYGVIHTADMLRVMEQRSGQDLDVFFMQWLGR